MKILIYGFGNIGKHTYNEFKQTNIEIDIYDKYNLDVNTTPLKTEYDAAFICVPTEMNEDGTVNTTEVFDAVNKARLLARVVIIKSAVPVGTCKALGYGNIVISPEYYGTTQHSLESPNFIVIGSNNQIAKERAADIYSRVKDGSFKYIFVDAETAELAKYMENCWIATKVTFCNEFASIAEAYGISYPELRECFIADERVNPSHTYVYKDKPYFDSHCLNKDIPGLIEMCKQKKIDTPLMSSILNIKQEREKRNV